MEGVLAKELNEEDVELHAAIIAINQALVQHDLQKLEWSLRLKSAMLSNVRDDVMEAYYAHLSKKQVGKSSNDLSDCSEEIYDSFLKREEIQEGLDMVNERLAILAINNAVVENIPANTTCALKNIDAGIRFVNEENSIFYQNRLANARISKLKLKTSSSSSLEDGGEHIGVLHSSKATSAKDRIGKLKEVDCESGYGGSVNSLNETDSHSSSPLNSIPNDISGEALLTKNEIQGHVNAVNREISDRRLKACILLQSLYRGMKARAYAKELLEKRKSDSRFIALAKLKFFLAGRVARIKYLKRLKSFRDNESAIVKIQSWQRGRTVRSAYLGRIAFFKSNESSVFRMQNWWRQRSAMKHYRELTGFQHPPVGAVRSFLHLLDQSNVDYSEELQLQRLRQKAVLSIRQNQSLAKQLNIMDIKIGLLVRNRIGLDEVVAQSKKYKKKSFSVKENHEAGLKALTKDNRDKLESYQHLFYLLQTEPDYLAKLIYLQPPSKTSRFMESVVLTVFNYAQNSREEYLLLKLFESAIKEEMNNVHEIKDFTSGNPTVIKMVVHYNRGAKERLFLRELLRPLMLKVLDQIDLHLNTNPVDIYKSWINNTEAETGKASGLPYDVTPEEALKQEHVRNIFNERIANLKAFTDQFLDVICKASSSFPYGIRYIAMQLKNMLTVKFNGVVEADDILKVVGNLIYYRYVNPAVVAPDAFDVVESSTDILISSHERRNLGEISKVLQHISSNKWFGEGEGYLSVLNDYISERFQIFKQFFEDVSSVSTAEEHFGIDQYSEVRTLSRPIIYISPKEIYSTHALIAEHIDELSSEEDSKLKSILNDLGHVPNLDALMSSQENIIDSSENSALAACNEGEVSLVLQDKFEESPDDDHDKIVLFLRTKRLLVNVIRFQAGRSLVEILSTECTAEQNQNHIANVLKNNSLKDEHDNRMTKEEKHSSFRPQSDIGPW